MEGFTSILDLGHVSVCETCSAVVRMTDRQRHAAWHGQSVPPVVTPIPRSRFMSAKMAPYYSIPTVVS